MLTMGSAPCMAVRVAGVGGKRLADLGGGGAR